MAGTVSPGQMLTPNPNVLAVAGTGGDTWGANGGGAVAVGGGAVDQTGYVKPIAITPSDCETALNYVPSNVNRAPPARPVLGQENIGQLSGQVSDSTLASGGSNAG
jgi:hypothetical protein